MIGGDVYEDGINKIKIMKIISDDVEIDKCEFLLQEGESIEYKKF